MKIVEQFFAQHIKWMIFLFCVLFSIPLILPYFHSGFFPTHDGEWAVVRLGDMYRELKDLQFPPRYSGNLNFGYGYPLFEFAYPLPYYFGIVIYFFHVGFVNAIKIVFALTIPFSLWGMYLLAKELWNSRFVGFVSAILYVYYPYRLVDLFVRGSIGESVSFALFPFIIYFLLRVHKNHSTIFALSAGICIAALVMSHNIMAVEFLPIILLFMLVSVWQHTEQRGLVAKKYLSTLLIGFGLSCFFWLPALSEKNLISLAVTPIADRSLYFVSLWQLFVPTWGYGVPTASDAFTYQIGIPQIVILFFLLLSFFFYKRMVKHSDFISLLFFVLSGLCIIYFLLLFSFSDFIWVHVPLLKEINYPWTLLGVIGFLIALISGRLFVARRIRFVFIIIAIAAVLYCLSYAHPSNYIDRGDGYYLTNDATTTSSSEYMPLWVKQKPFQRIDTKFVALQTNAMITNQFSNSKKFFAIVTSSKPFVLQINTIYFPGWKVTVDGKPTTIMYANKFGLMQVRIPAGQHTISGMFTETPLRLFSDIVSLLSLLVIIRYFGKRILKR